MYWSFCNRAISRVAAALLASVLMSAALAGESDTAGDTAAGKAVYSQTCIACHGKNGKGALPGVSDLTKSDGPLAKTDEELMQSISNGLTTPGAALSMPAKGGIPSLTEDDIRAVLAYLRGAYGN